MGNKERITARIDPEVKDQLDSADRNTSGLVRTLLHGYFRIGDSVEVALERRLKDKENELERKRLELTRLENDIERTEREIEQIQTKIEERRSSVPKEVVKFATMCGDDGKFPRENLDADNPAVQNYASKAGLSVRDFIEQVEDEIEN